MISFLNGWIFQPERNGSIVIHVGDSPSRPGVAYSVTCHDRDQRILNERGAGGEAALFVRAVYREDSQRLYGFREETDRHLFDRMIALDGVGPSVALKVLSRYDAAQVAAIVAKGDALAFTGPGIAAKTRDKLIEGLKP